MGKIVNKWRKWRSIGAALLVLTGVGAPTAAVLLGVGDIVVQQVDEHQSEKENADE